MKITRNRKSKTGRIEIIPMIDVMFFLLVTFMLASLSMQRFSGLAVNLTKGKADAVSVENQVTITIDQQSRVFLDKEQVSLEQLKSRLESMSSEDKSVIVMSDKAATQGAVMQAMLAAKAAGVKHFSLISKE